MKKNTKRTLSLTALTAVTAAAVVAPVSALADEQQQVAVNSVIIDVNGEKVAVSIIEYAKAVGGANATLLNYLKGENDYPTVAAVDFGGKLVGITEYATAVGDGTATPEEIFENVTDTPIDDLKEYKGIDEETGEPIVEPIEDPGTDPDPDPELTVESVMAINAKQVEVKFNTTLDKKSAENLTNYTFGLQASPSTNVATVVGGASATLKEDGKTVVLTLNTASSISNDTTKNVVTVKKELQTADGKALGTDYTSYVTFQDSTLPTATGITQTGAKQIVIQFNEPVTAQDNTFTQGGITELSIDNGAIPIDTVVSDIKNNTLVVTTYGDIPAGSHEVKLVSGALKDFTGFVNFEQKLNFTSTKDESVPTVSVKKADAGKVTLKFSKKVIIPANNNVTFRAVYNNASNQIQAQTNAALIFKADGTTQYDNTLTDEIVLDFPSDLPPGNVDIFIEYVSTTNTTDVIKDGYSVTLPEQKVVANVVADTVKPTIAKIEAKNSTTVDVTFSEEVDATTSQVAGNYLLKDPKGNVVSVTGASLQTGNKTVRLTTANLDGGTYSLEVKNVKDRAVPAANTIDTVTTTFEAKDSKAPTATVQYIEADGVSQKDKIIINYSEIMATTGAGSVVDKGNYQYTIDNGVTYKSLTDKDTVEISADGKTVTISLDENVTFGAGATNKVKFGAVADLAGNKVGIGLTVDAASATVGITSAAFTAKDRLEVTFDKALSTVQASDIELVSDADGTSFTGVNEINLTVYSHGIEDGKSKVVYSLDKNVGLNGQYQGVAVALKVSTATGTKTVDGIVLGDLAYNANFTLLPDQTTPKANVVADKIAPALATTDAIQTVDVDGDGKVDHIQITFQEAVAAGSVSLDKFTVNGYTVKDAYATTAITGATDSARATAGAVDGSIVLVRVEEKTSTDITAAPTVTIGSGLTDVAGNAFTFVETKTKALANAVEGVTAAVATSQGSAGTAQVETATAAGTVTTAGNATVTVTANATNLTTGKAITVAVDLADDAAAIAGKIRNELGSDADVSNAFTVGGTGTAITLTAKTPAANDTTLNIAIADDTSVGVTAAPTSANTTEGVAPVTEKVTITVTGTATAAGQLVINAGGKVYYVPVANGAVQNDIATAIHNAITADAPTGFTSGVATNVVTLTSGTPNTNVTDLVVTVQ